MNSAPPSLRPVAGSAVQILALLRAWEHASDPEPLLIETSGSSGIPKQVALSRAAMRASARATHERLGGPGQWVLNLPPAYVAGVQVLFRCVLADVEPVLLAAGESLQDARERITAGRSYVSLVPTQLVRLLRDDETWLERQALGAFDGVLIGGGPLDPAVRREAERQGITIVQTYGMSETCGGCVYDGMPLDGVQVRIRGDGQVLLRGPMLFDGYSGEPERTAATLDDGWLVTHDIGALSGGRLRVDGRVDDVIISGGVKVPAVAVAAMLSGDPAVVEAAVIGVPDEEWGQRVVAAVEARDPLTLAGLRDLVEPRAWAPRQLLVLPELPRLPNGKVDRQELLRQACRG